MIATRAAVLRGADEPFLVEPVVISEPGPGQILVKVASCGVCPTDLLPRRADRGLAFPMVPGHEGSGVVVATGPHVGTKVGDHVVLSFDSCADCARCEAAEPAYCEAFFPRNLDGFEPDGSSTMRDDAGNAVGNRWFGQSSFAAHALVAERNAVAVGGELPLEKLGPLGCGVLTGAGAVLVALRVEPGSRLIIFGAGAVGLSSVMAARLAGAANVTVVEPHASRRELALDLGADRALEPDDDDRGGAFDYAIDTTGSPDVARQALNALGTRGVCGLVGIPAGDPAFDRAALAAGRTVTGILMGSTVPRLLIPRLIELWRQGRFPFDRLLRTYPLAEVNQAVAATLAGEVVKPVLLPEE